MWVKRREKRFGKVTGFVRAGEAGKMVIGFMCVGEVCRGLVGASRVV